MDIFTIVLLVILSIFLIIFFYYVPFMLWINAQVSGVRISLVQLFLMRIRKVPPTKIVNCLIEAHKAGLQDVKRDDVAQLFIIHPQKLAGGAMNFLSSLFSTHPDTKKRIEILEQF